MLAARIGAAFTAELGTMTVSEEVEAIEAMGIGRCGFLVAPRMLALFFPDALSFHDLEHIGDFRLEFDLESLLRDRISPTLSISSAIRY
jgi:hypothetical protein